MREIGRLIGVVFAGVWGSSSRGFVMGFLSMKVRGLSVKDVHWFGLGNFLLSGADLLLMEVWRFFLVLLVWVRLFFNED